jgi:hypothetical protein
MPEPAMIGSPIKPPRLITRPIEKLPKQRPASTPWSGATAPTPRPISAPATISPE